MTRKDFQLIAETLAASKPEAHWSANKGAQWLVTCNRFADRLASTNPNFDRARFLAACGVEG